MFEVVELLLLNINYKDFEDNYNYFKYLKLLVVLVGSININAQNQNKSINKEKILEQLNQKIKSIEPFLDEYFEVIKLAKSFDLTSIKNNNNNNNKNNNNNTKELNLELLKTKLESKTLLELSYSDRKSLYFPLLYACKKNKLGIFKFLIKKNAPMNILENIKLPKDTILKFAAINNSVEIVALILEKINYTIKEEYEIYIDHLRKLITMLNNSNKFDNTSNNNAKNKIIQLFKNKISLLENNYKKKNIYIF